MEYHPNYDSYVEMIVSHPNYEGLYYDRDKNGKVNWVVTGKSPKGQIRQQWWDDKCRELGVPIQKGCYAKVARMIHPTGLHICQCCGEERSIFYEYPTLPTLRKLCNILGISIKQTDYTIKEIINNFCTTNTKLSEVAGYFGLNKPKNKETLIQYIYDELVANESPKFSPGVMCNPPDRFNGFHSYALCCRKEKDTGRHDDNMKTYTQDRRAYENWSEGDYNLANRLMGEFHKAEPIECPICHQIKEMSADHIGPVSLGFCHSRYFTPLCNSCNSAKNNRFTKEDVDKLIEIEKNGGQVISWHSKYIWDAIKDKILTDKDAKLASSIMAKCHQSILYVFSIIYKAKGEEFLMRYLHPEYSLVNYSFRNFDLRDLSKLEIIQTPLNSKNKRNNQERYIRISFESLDDFASKENRKNYIALGKESYEVQRIIELIDEKQYNDADLLLKQTCKSISDIIYRMEWNNTGDTK